MNREKEIIEAGIEYTMKNRPNVLAGGKFSEEMREFNRNKHFEKGAEWADKTMIEKARKWLYNNTYKISLDDNRLSMSFEHTIDMIDNFCKAMEE